MNPARGVNIGLNVLNVFVVELYLAPILVLFTVVFALDYTRISLDRHWLIGCALLLDVKELLSIFIVSWVQLLCSQRKRVVLRHIESICVARRVSDLFSVVNFCLS